TRFFIQQVIELHPGGGTCMFSSNGGVGRLIVDDDRRFVKVMYNYIMFAAGQLDVAVVHQRQVAHSPPVQLQVYRSRLGGKESAHGTTWNGVVGSKGGSLIGQHLAIQFYFVDIVCRSGCGRHHVVQLELCRGRIVDWGSVVLHHMFLTSRESHDGDEGPYYLIE